MSYILIHFILIIDQSNVEPIADVDVKEKLEMWSKLIMLEVSMKHMNLLLKLAIGITTVEIVNNFALVTSNVFVAKTRTALVAKINKDKELIQKRTQKIVLHAMLAARVDLIVHVVQTVNAALISLIVATARMVIVTVSITVHVGLFVNAVRSL